MINNLMYIELKKVYPRPKQVKPKLTTAIKSTILMAQPSFPVDSLSGFYVIRGVLSAGGTRLAPTVTECRPQSLC